MSRLADEIDRISKQSDNQFEASSDTVANAFEKALDKVVEELEDRKKFNEGVKFLYEKDKSI